MATRKRTKKDAPETAGWKKNQEIRLTIEDFTKEGEGLGKCQGFPFFVKDTVIGDEVLATVTKVKKNYGYARMTKLLRPSEDRVEAPCPVARQCGGCRLQHISYEKQVDFKWKQVANCLKRIGGFPDAEEKLEPVCAMENPWHYRNKAQYPIGKDRAGNPVAGFYAGRTHTIVPNTDCRIQAKVNREILAIVLSYMKENGVPPYEEDTHTGLVRHVLTRVGFSTGEIMVCLILNGTGRDLPRAGSLVEALKQIPGMASILVNTNRERTNRILGAACETLWGKDAIEDAIGSVRYRIGPLSFYQVNPAQTRILYEKALAYAGLTGREIVWDLYCGIGTISLFLARNAAQVYGVEVVEEAVADARINAAMNALENVTFFSGRAEDVLPREYERTGVRPDVIVVDPPRKGCDASLLRTMIEMAPRRIVYVSCDPATLARDCRILCDGGYELEKAAAVDQFPHSTHIESVCRLVLRTAERTE